MARSASNSSSDLTSAAPRVTEGEVAQRYDIQQSIGHGAFGEALLALRHEDGLVVVVKRVRISDLSDKEREGAINEVKLLAQFHHTNIIRYYECIVEDGHLNIVMEYADEGELSTVLQRRADNKKPYKEDQIMFMFVQLALALLHVHGKNVLHRDLKSANIFLSKGGVLKLGDFGISRVLNSSASMARTAIGTPYYLSPEILEDQPYNAKSDVWALGCILYELTTLKRAFDGAHLPGLIGKILRGVIPPIPTKYSSSLRNLVTSMLKQRPEDRPTVQQILRQDYVRQYVTRYARYMMDQTDGSDEEPALGLERLPGAATTPPGRPLIPQRQTFVGEAPATALPSDTVTATASSALATAAPARQAAPVHRRRWSASKRQAAQEQREVAEVANLPDDPRRAAGEPASPASVLAAAAPDHQGLQVQGMAAPRSSPALAAAGMQPASASGSAKESFNQAAVSIAAQVNNPQPTGMVGAGTRVRPRGPGLAGTKSQGPSSSIWLQSPSADQHVKMDVRKAKYEIENQQKVRAAREHKAQVKMEKDRREREEAARLREEKRAAKLLKEQEDARKAKEKEEQQARKVEHEAQLREKASLKAREKQESRRRLQEHKESLRTVKPTLDRASLRRDFAARQQAQDDAAEGGFVFVPLDRAASAAAELPQPEQSRAEPASSSRPHYHGSAARSPPRKSGSAAGSQQKPAARKTHSKFGGLKQPAPADLPAEAAAKPPPSPPVQRHRRRLWSKQKAQGPQIPAVEIYVPSLKVWEDDDDDDDDGGAAQEPERQAEARAEVTDGLRELRDFMNVNKQRQDPVKQIWDQRKGRELLQVLEEMQDVLDWEGDEEARPGSSSKTGGNHGAPWQQPHPAEATAARIERLRDDLERQLGFERFLAVYKCLRSAQDNEEGSPGAQLGLDSVLGADEMHFVRDVNKLMIMEDKVFA